MTMKCSCFSCFSLVLVICITDQLTSVSGQDTRYVQRTAVNSYENYNEVIESLVAEIMLENRQLKLELDELRKQYQQQVTTGATVSMTTTHQSMTSSVTPATLTTRPPTGILSVRQYQTITSVSRPGRSIWAVATRSSKLYVGYNINTLVIYDTTTFSPQRELNISDSRCISDIASCPDCDVVFVINCYPYVIHVIDDVGLRTQWNISDQAYQPVGISVNSQSNVIVTSVSPPKLREYTPSGELVREITLKSDIDYAWHAIQLDTDRYVVSHGVATDGILNRVCIVDGNGSVVQCYGEQHGSGTGQLGQPEHLALFGESLLVADYINYRVLQLNVSSLTYVGELINTSNEGCSPRRLALNEDGTRLYGVFYGSSDNSLRAYDLITGT